MPLTRGGIFLACSLGLALDASAAHANEPTKQECVAANESAQDLQRAGKLRDARGQLIMCAAKACPGAVREDCAERLRAVDQALPSVIFRLVVPPRSAGRIDVSAARVAVDGVALPDPLDGTAIPVDPGAHTFTFSVGDRPPVAVQLSIHEGERLERDVALEPNVSTEAREHSTSDARWSTTRLLGWTALGAGAAGVTLGTVFGFLAVGNKSSLSGACHEKVCPESAESDIEAMHVNGVACNISLAVGVLGLGAGAALLVLFPEDKSPDIEHDRAASLDLRASVGVGQVGISGRFR